MSLSLYTLLLSGSDLRNVTFEPADVLFLIPPAYIWFRSGPKCFWTVSLQSLVFTLYLTQSEPFQTLSNVCVCASSLADSFHKAFYRKLLLIGNFLQSGPDIGRGKGFKLTTGAAESKFLTFFFWVYLFFYWESSYLEIVINSSSLTKCANAQSVARWELWKYNYSSLKRVRLRKTIVLIEDPIHWTTQQSHSFSTQTSLWEFSYSSANGQGWTVC